MSRSDLTELSRSLDESLDSSTIDLAMSPPEDAIIDAVDDDITDPDHAESDDRVYTPPPHIAARLFYHPTNQARRKDSAASSRRGSISSVHSRSSHGACSLSGTAASQSKYLAQHLRRTSILETRKARLADRAAHAEKVRLRAALAKAATKDISASEERAIAAAQAREKNLADIAATCAEEVKRARAVAESMKDRREQEIRKMKLQMDERMAEAERRREELRVRHAARASKTRERGHSLSLLTKKSPLAEPPLTDADEQLSRPAPPTPRAPMTEDVAVSKIQWWWRAALRRQAVADFAALGLTVDGVRSTSFEAVTELLARQNVLISTARILRICGLREGDTGSVDEMAAVRTFLSAFLILSHPAQVLNSKEGKGEQEQDLVGKARDLLISFENILSHLTSLNRYTPPPALLQTLSEVYASFYNAFIAWKARDSNSLVEVMVMQFVELDAIWQTVKDNTDGSVDEVYRQSIQDNQLKLMVRIKKLAGPQQGKKMVFDAVRQARKARAKKPTGDMKPRGAETETGGDPSSSATSAEQQAQTPTPPATPSSSHHHHENDGQTVRVQVHPPGRTGGLLPDNRIVVHELAIDREFRIAADEYREQQEHFLGPLFREMRATVETDDQDTHFFILLEMAKSIREKLQRLVTPGNSMHNFIAELLDTDVAQRQFTAGSFSYEKFFRAMGSLLPKLCAPVRDDEVRELIDERLSQGHYVDRLEALMGFIDVMLSDYANYLLQRAAPQIVESATPYEAKLFASDVEGGLYDLSAAEAAWRAAHAKVYAEAARRDPERIGHPRSRPTPNRIYSQMLVDLFTQPTPLREDAVPEMLRLDYKRAARSGHTTRRIITTGAVLLQCKNMLKRDVRAPWRTEAARIYNVLEAAEQPRSAGQAPETTTDGVMAVLESGRTIPAATKTHLRALVTKLVAASAELATTDGETDAGADAVREPVLRLLLNRLRGHVLSRLAAASASEKVRATSTAGERLAGLGLAEFVEKVRDMVDEMAKVGTVDRDAHSVWWETVAARVDAGSEEAAGSSS